MLNNKKVNILISFLVAVGLWVYVIGEVNPTTTENLYNIPIEMINQDALTDKGLSIAYQSNTNINITVKGVKSEISKLEDGDVQAYIDLAGLEKGDSQPKVEIILPQGIEVVQTNFETVYITVEATIYAQKNVQVEFDEGQVNGFVPHVESMSKELIGIYGATSLVNRVDHVIATVETSGLTESVSIVTPVLKAVDSNGAVVEGIKLNESLTIEAILYKVATLPLEVEIIGREDGTYEKHITVPEQVTVVGPADIVEELTVVSAESIDVSEITTNTEIQVVPILSKKVRVVDIEDLVVKVTVEEEVTRAITFETSDIRIDNLPEDKTINFVAQKIIINVTGKQEVIDAIIAGDLLVVIDVNNLDIGEHSVKVTATSTKDIRLIEVVPSDLVIDIN